MLSDFVNSQYSRAFVSLNAPFGAQCFPTEYGEWATAELLVASQCTFWCSVLSDGGRLRLLTSSAACLNAPFGAQCFPTHHTGDDYYVVV